MSPGWLAALVLTIARETGWSEQYIAEELPLARAYQYEHVALVLHGNECQADSDASAIPSLQQQLAEIRKCSPCSLIPED